jgi:peptidoglycan/xylan/chitin deacetylase (PgdA/CDA1 family)
MIWRSAAKAVLERALARSGVPQAARRRRSSDVIILAYHNVVPRGEGAVGELSLHVSAADFSAQLEVLAETHEVVPLEATSEIAPERSSRPRAAVTFDDAYRGAITAGIAAAVSCALPVTVFIAPKFVGGKSFWWDALAGVGEMPISFRNRALWEYGGDDSKVRSFAASVGIKERSIPEHATCAHAHELAQAAAQPGVRFGPHSWSHVNLAALDEETLKSELRDSYDWVKAEYPRAAAADISYPYGLSSARVERMASAQGFGRGLRIEGGWYRPGHDPRFAVPRLNIAANLSRDGFLIQTSGLSLRRLIGGLV